jgi:ribose transport system permease protein
MKMPGVLKKIFSRNETAVTLIFLGMCLITGLLNPAFLSGTNLVNILRAVSLSLIPAIGLTIVLSGGGIDLSCGSTLAFVGIAFGYMYGVHHMNLWLALFLGLSIAACIGLTSGILVSYLPVHSMIITLGMMKVCRGLIDVIAGGRAATGFSEGFRRMGQGTILTLPNTVWIAFTVFILAIIFTKYTVTGRTFIAIGGNEEATRLAGINVKKYKILSFVICSVLAGFSGIVLASRLGSSQPTAGMTQDMNVIASAVIGGNSLSGGDANIFGTLIGVAIMEILTVALTLIHVSAYWQNVCIGIIVIIAVCIDGFQHKRKLNKV